MSCIKKGVNCKCSVLVTICTYTLHYGQFWNKSVQILNTHTLNAKILSDQLSSKLPNPNLSKFAIDEIGDIIELDKCAN